MENAHLLSRQQLIDTYASYGRPKGRWLVGGEFERHLLNPNGLPLTYDEPNGIRWLLEQMVIQRALPYRERGHIIAARRNRASITLEPGGQFELAGKPMKTSRDVMAEADAFITLIDSALEGTGTRQSSLGYTPFAPIENIRWVPKGRYGIMKAHMEKVGALGHYMMKGTCATQASYDFSNEEDAAKKMQLGINLGPLVTAMFANSPLTAGRPNGWKSFRGYIWTQTDPARTGFPDAAATFSYARWVDYLLDVPMMFTHIGGVWKAADGLTFRQWMENGDENGIYPTMADWDLHQTSVFPEVRIKNLIEMRMADCVSVPLSGAFCALFEGLLYDQAALDRGLALGRSLSRFGTRHERFLSACTHGLRGTIGGRHTAWWAEQMIDAAASGLSRVAPESVPLLEPLKDLVSHGECPADRLLAHLGGQFEPERVRELTHPQVLLPHIG